MNAVTTAAPAVPDRRVRRYRLDLRLYIIAAACLWWLLLALLSRLELSALQIPWNGTAKFAIFFFFPFCMLLGAIPVLAFPLRRRAVEAFEEVGLNRELRFLYYTALTAFAVQCVVFLPPALSGDPMNARLDWGVKYLHVATEILVRTGVLVCVGAIVSRGRMVVADARVLLPALAYAVLVVSRGLILEIIIYFIFASIVNSRSKLAGFRIRPKHVFWFGVVAGFFVLYGEWRQGDDFSVTEYGEMFVDSNALAWMFGYFLVNLDNLALVIMEGFQNTSVTNVFGPLLQTLQIMEFEEVDEYLYVGRFNLGTALRPFVLDFGPWGGGFGFAILWSLVLLLPNLCRLNSNRSAILVALAYMSFIFPITGRIEQPAYMVPILLIILSDRFDWHALLRRRRRRASIASQAAGGAG